MSANEDGRRASGWRGLPTKKPAVIIALLVFVVLLALAAIRPFADRGDGAEEENNVATSSQQMQDVAGAKAD